ncbi:MAG TPA: hypothetical protein VNM14_23045 [Planctomycetota bacterium]|nr:hypothetical protein [Planctomycetota bacterium]
MKFAAAVLTILVLPPATPRPPAATPPPAPSINSVGQEWFADPVLPSIFKDNADPGVAEDGSLSALDLRYFLMHSSTGRQDAAPGAQTPAPESTFPRGVGAPEIEAWRREDDLRRIREFASDATLGLPLLVPQLFLEAFLPNGLAVGPTTFLYKTSSPSNSLPLVVFDQVLFHEAEFFSQAQFASDAAYAEHYFQTGQRRILRRALTGGFRASYAIPRMSFEQMLETADEQGAVGYALLPPAAAVLLYLKGIDQKMKLDDDVRVRFKIASGQNVFRGLHSENGNPCFSVELRLCELPVGIIASFDISDRGMTPAFVGLGTTLDAVEELLSREASSRLPPDAR